MQKCMGEVLHRCTKQEINPCNLLRYNKTHILSLVLSLSLSLSHVLSSLTMLVIVLLLVIVGIHFVVYLQQHLCDHKCWLKEWHSHLHRLICHRQRARIDQLRSTCLFK
jgi:hypothetical protein